jgi:hypothetical protein
MVAMQRLTFLLAVIGYAGLTTTAVVATARRFPWRFWRPVVAIIVAHVLMVWAVRYGWSLAAATRNGYAGFLLFHGVLALIVGSFLVEDRVARRLVWTSFAMVTFGALFAVFNDDEVAIYRIPVILFAVAGVSGIATLRRRGGDPVVNQSV